MASQLEKALLYPVEGLLKSLPQKPHILYINAVDEGHMTHPVFSKGDLDVVQWHITASQAYKNHAQNLFSGFEKIKGIYDLILLRATKQKIETRGLLAHAALLLDPNGILVCAGLNDGGGKTLRRDCELLRLDTTEHSKHKCRIIEAHHHVNPIQDTKDTKLQWISEYKPQLLDDIGFVTRPGLFGWRKIDQGSALLAKHLPRKLKGLVADFGCGYGYLSSFIIENCADVTELFCIDADSRAIECCHMNMENIDPQMPYIMKWADATDMPEYAGHFDHIVMNPPFHEDKATELALGKKFIESARKCLKNKGQLWMVANDHLAYEDILRQKFDTVESLTEEQGFKVIHATAG